MVGNFNALSFLGGSLLTVVSSFFGYYYIRSLKFKFKVGDIVVFPSGSSEEKDRFRLIEGKIIDRRGRISPKYSVFYHDEKTGLDKIIVLDEDEIYLKNTVYA